MLERTQKLELWGSEEEEEEKIRDRVGGVVHNQKL
jgi:hypothetical protein